MFVIAHFAKLPVEETLPFLVPVILLAFWARREDLGYVESTTPRVAIAVRG